jgi:hypothetical protein
VTIIDPASQREVGFCCLGKGFFPMTKEELIEQMAKDAGIFKVAAGNSTKIDRNGNTNSDICPTQL